MLWRLLPQLLGIAALGVVSLIDYLWWKKNTIKFRWARRGLFLLIFLLLVASIIDIWQQERANAELRSQLNEVKNLQTGGDSYCWLSPTRPLSDSKSVDFMVLHEGKYPVFDSFVRIEDVNRNLEIHRDLDAKGKLPFHSIAEYNAAVEPSYRSFPLGTVPPGRGAMLSVPLSGRDEAHYFVELFGRNGRTFEEIVFHRVKGEWKLGYRVSPTGSNGFPKKYLDDDFPGDLRKSWE